MDSIRNYQAWAHRTDIEERAAQSKKERKIQNKQAISKRNGTREIVMYYGKQDEGTKQEEKRDEEREKK